MRNTLVPSVEPNLDVTVYMVLDDFGDLGVAYVETDIAKADEPTIIDNILTGQYSSPIRVVAFNASEGWSRDVSEDIAYKVLKRWEGQPGGNSARGFLERVLGVDAPVGDF
jgi:hypothetical protein